MAPHSKPFGTADPQVLLLQTGMCRKLTEIEKPTRITNWRGFDLASLSATSNSQQIAFKGLTHHVTVYLADL